MNKKTFMWILQYALLNWDDMSFNELIEMGATPFEATSGIRLCFYLKSIKSPEEKTEQELIQNAT